MNKIKIKNFKKTLSKFVTGVTVVCVKHNNKIYGKTINSFNALSLSPPLVLFSLGHKSSSIEAYSKSKYLSINILSNKQKNLSNHFSKKNPSSLKINFFDGKNNTKMINDCIANLECRLFKKIKMGDHLLFICEVLYVNYNNKLKPLYYFNSKYN